MAKSSTGLEENIAGLLCYVLGWVTGLIFFLIEKESKFYSFRRRRVMRMNHQISCIRKNRDRFFGQGGRTLPFSLGLGVAGILNRGNLPHKSILLQPD